VIFNCASCAKTFEKKAKNAMSGEWKPLLNPAIEIQTNQAVNFGPFTLGVNFDERTIVVIQNWGPITFRGTRYLSSGGQLVDTPPWTSADLLRFQQEVEFAMRWWNQSAASIRVVAEQDAQYRGKFVYEKVLKRFATGGFSLRFQLNTNAGNGLARHWSVDAVKSNPRDSSLTPHSPNWSHVQATPGQSVAGKVVLNTAHMARPFSYILPEQTATEAARTSLNPLPGGFLPPPSQTEVNRDYLIRPAVIAHEFGHTLYFWLVNPNTPGNEGIFYQGPDEYQPPGAKVATTEFLQRAQGRYSVKTIPSGKLPYNQNTDALMGNSWASMTVHGRYYIPILISLAYAMPGLWFNVKSR
jgi:hypothetical protein